MSRPTYHPQEKNLRYRADAREGTQIQHGMSGRPDRAELGRNWPVGLRHDYELE